ncbi:MAG: TonB-dependent receptor [candidate division KSB1 bacterium]|nr:TonB-dependent receptor [candidate division KSB1 bacterium]MDZ7273898.1 TonB-dependent receptor [candidate division KSB1 bacterium]MDZ7286054.1 TonB-dependent receptor [candidate division KSB1 bacterium]MDZ7299086.1 TonB-dependent receptor [candidate division KSB1 bacterium]MDZ7306389.1 TonB-dependent receptor [candidate division KSB1 bacterium]
MSSRQGHVRQRRIIACVLVWMGLVPGLCRATEVSGRQSGIWNLAGSPYLVTGDVVVPLADTLVIQAGVVVKFAGAFSIKVHGVLIANGTVADRIVFTSAYDNEFGWSGVTSRRLPTLRDWQGIELLGEGRSGSQLSFCVIRYSDHAIIARNVQPVLKNLIITDCDVDKLMINGRGVPVLDGIESDYSLAPDPRAAESSPLSGEEPHLPVVAEKNGGEAVVNTTLTAEATVLGFVSDSETGERLPGASLELIPEGIAGQATGTITGPNGEFEIKEVIPGIYTITTSYIGYEKKVMQQVELSPGMTKALEISLLHVGLQLNPVIITASRRPEKIFEAPVAISLLEGTQLQSRSVLTPLEHIKTLPAVDFAATGINQANVVVRGFNNVFSGALLAQVDNRIAGLPSLRFNAYNLIPIANEDLERIEVVSGPGAALYGPNSANGVVHLITKSPFGAEGTSLSAGGGERIEFIGSFRHANSLGDRLGYKISGQFYQGVDWFSRDPAEPEFFEIAGKRVPAPGRDFDVERLSLDARLDFRPAAGMTGILSAGFSQISDIELTGVGAAQARDWRFYYLQGRLYYKSLFAQAYLNQTDAGDTYLLRSGAPIVDRSSLLVGQVHHGFTLGRRQRFTYGFDVLQTRPNTGGTINNRHEPFDRIDERGAFLQSETSLMPRLSAILAARLDDHTFIKGQVLSPRAALLFKPWERHTLRLTYNQAYSTPSANNLFLDILSTTVPTRSINPALEPVLGPVFFELYAEGTAPRRGGFARTSAGGFTFRRGADQRPQMISLLGAAAGAGSGYLPPDVNPVWPALRNLILASQPAGPAREALAAALPRSLSATVPGVLRAFNPTSRAFDVPVLTVSDIPLTKPTITTTTEIGYKGLWYQKLLVGIDLYRTRVRDFVGPLTVETPHVFVDPAALTQVLARDLAANGFAPAAAQATAQSIAQSLANLPLGLISPQEVQSATEVIMTYRNFGDISFYGADLSLGWVLNRSWRLALNYSHVSRDFFASNARQPHDIALNAPRNKFSASVCFSALNTGLEAEARLRHIEGFPVLSGVYLGAVQTHTVLDWDLSFNLSRSTQALISVQNVLDDPYRAFVGAPLIGRMVILRLVQSL